MTTGRASARAAAAWAAGFGALSCAWGAGATVGAGTVGVELERLARERDPGMVATLWATGALKLAAAALVLALAHGWTRRGVGWRALRWAVGAAGAGMALYGLASGVQHALMAAGAIDTPAALGTAAVTWHLVLWDPLWLLGGVLFLLAALAADRAAAASGARVR